MSRTNKLKKKYEILINGTTIKFIDFIKFIIKDRPIDITLDDNIVDEFLTSLKSDDEDEKKAYKEWIRVIYHDIKNEYPSFTSTIEKHKNLIRIAWIQLKAQCIFEHIGRNIFNEIDTINDLNII